MYSMNEQAIRGRAARNGYIVRKSRSRNPSAPGFGGFMLVDSATNVAVCGTTPFSFSADLEDIAGYLDD